VRIDELLWDDWNEEHISRHRVREDEVEEVVFDRASQFFRVGRGGAARRYLILGLTDAGRYLFVVIELAPGNRGYPITARDMTDGEKRQFKQRR
jgi:uncharacterized protein